MKAQRCAMILSMLIAFGLLQHTVAQKRLEYFWVTGGLGVAPERFAGKVALSCQVDRTLLTLRLSGTSEVRLFGGPSPLESEIDVAVLYGVRHYRADFFTASLSVGGGIVKGMRRGRYIGSSGGWFSFTDYYEELPFITVGLAFDAESMFTPFSFFGLGLDVIGNLNPQHSFVGAIICIHLGKVN